MGDLFLRNARIWTGDLARPWADAALARDGHFAFVGREQEARIPPRVQTLDANGRLVLPGLSDGHAHLLNTGLAMRSVDLKGVATVDEAARRVAERANAVAQGGWIRGAGWDQNAWPDSRFPSRHDLDAGTRDHPVALIHTSGHCLWANSAALRAAGVTADTKAPSGGAIDVDEDGEPTGILRDAAAALVYDAMPKPSHKERIEAVEEALARAQSLGLTSVHAMDVGRGEWEALKSLHGEERLRVRVRPFLAAGRIEEWIDEGLRTGDGDDLLRLGGVKFFADGALGSLTAWMLEPYEGSDDTGLALQPAEELERRVRRCLQNGLAPAVHAIGDRANREVLDILGRAADLSPELPRRVEHAQLLTEDDLPRFASLGVTASVQPIHATQDMTKVDRGWGERGRYAYPFATLMAGGAALAFGSDSPVETMDPLAGVHAAVTRRNASGTPRDGWYPGERISLEAALAAYTSGCARATHEEGALGRIAPGFRADFFLLSDDLFEIDDPMRILDAHVDATIVGGDIVYERKT